MPAAPTTSGTMVFSGGVTGTKKSKSRTRTKKKARSRRVRNTSVLK